MFRLSKLLFVFCIVISSTGCFKTLEGDKILKKANKLEMKKKPFVTTKTYYNAYKAYKKEKADKHANSLKPKLKVLFNNLIDVVGNRTFKRSIKAKITKKKFRNSAAVILVETMAITLGMKSEAKYKNFKKQMKQYRYKIEVLASSGSRKGVLLINDLFD